jgi:hypothetical protein
MACFAPDAGPPGVVVVVVVDVGVEAGRPLAQNAPLYAAGPILCGGPRLWQAPGPAVCWPALPDAPAPPGGIPPPRVVQTGEPFPVPLQTPQPEPLI